MDETIIRSRAPLRIGFFGGGTDVQPYPSEYGSAVLSATINKYAYATWIVKDGDITLESKDLNVKTKVEDFVYDGKYDLIKATLKIMDQKKGGHFFLQSDAPVGSGLGTSSAVNVGLVGVIMEGAGMSAQNPLSSTKTRYDIAKLAYKIEREELGIAGGFQDQYASTFGGFVLLEHSKGDNNISVTRLDISQDIIGEIEYCTLLCNIKQTRNGGNIIAEQKKAYEKKENIDILHGLKGLVEPGRRALVKGNIKHFGELLHESWTLKKNLAKGTSTPYIDALYEADMQTGDVYGGKITGAGAGGHLALICNPVKKLDVAKAILKKSIDMSTTMKLEDFVTFGEFSFEKKGLFVWKPQTP